MIDNENADTGVEDTTPTTDMSEESGEPKQKESQENPQEEAQAMLDSLSDQPDVCEALYELLKEKYDGSGDKPMSKIPETMDMEAEKE